MEKKYLFFILVVILSILVVVAISNLLPSDGVSGWATKVLREGNWSSCTDSDLGINYSLKGTIAATLNDGSVNTFIDTCISSIIIREEYCADNKLPLYVEIECNAGLECLNGACVNVSNSESSIITCSDSDDLNYSKKGTVTYTNSSGTISLQDTCAGQDSLTEFYCQSSSTYKAQTITCSSGKICSNGACIDNEILTQETQNNINSTNQTQNNTSETSTEENLKNSQNNFESSKDSNIDSESGFSISNNTSSVSSKNENYPRVSDCELDDIECLVEKLNQECEPTGLMIKEMYCSVDGIWTLQLEEGKYCENNFECTSYSCLDNKCIDREIWSKIVNFIAKFLD